MIRFNVTGARRKELVKKLEALTGQRAAYQGMPTMAYKVGGYTVTRDGTVEEDMPEEFISILARAGFIGEVMESPAPEEPPQQESDGITITIPLDNVSNETIRNFQNMIASKGELIKLAFKLDDLPMDYGEDTLAIRWFEEHTPDDVDAVTKLITAMFEKAGNQRHVSDKPVATDNAKYNWRVFINSCGFVGTEYKSLRKELMKNMTGSAAYRKPNVIKSK